MTRKVSFGGAISLDGFFAGRGPAIDWPRWGDEAAAVSEFRLEGRLPDDCPPARG